VNDRQSYLIPHLTPYLTSTGWNLDGDELSSDFVIDPINGSAMEAGDAVFYMGWTMHSSQAGATTCLTPRA
jgi:hypothetical protein